MNKFSILHISDLHRKPESFDNESLIFAIKKDIELLKENGISPPEFCIVTGDLIQGSLEDGEKSFIEIRKQYQITADLLTKIAEIILNKETKNVIILPGNHDRCLSLAKEAFSGLQLPDDDVEKKQLFYESQNPSALKRFCPVQLSYFIADISKYKNRFNLFSEFYNNFYNGNKIFNLDRDKQFTIHCFEERGLVIATLNSASGIDNFNTIPHIDKSAVTELCKLLDTPPYKNLLKIAAWHHNLKNHSSDTDSLNPEFTKYLKLVNVSLALHGHQHSAEINTLENIYWQSEALPIISAGSLCADDADLSYTAPRGYNIIELDCEVGIGKVSFRQMDKSHDYPMFSGYIFNETGKLFQEFKIHQITAKSINNNLKHKLNERLVYLLKIGDYKGVIDLIKINSDKEGLQIPLTSALVEINDPNLTLEMIQKPINLQQAILLAKSILEIGDKEKADIFIKSEFVKRNSHALNYFIIQLKGLTDGR